MRESSTSRRLLLRHCSAQIPAEAWSKDCARRCDLRGPKEYVELNVDNMAHTFTARDSCQMNCSCGPARFSDCMGIVVFVQGQRSVGGGRAEDSRRQESSRCRLNLLRTVHQVEKAHLHPVQLLFHPRKHKHQPTFNHLRLQMPTEYGTQAEQRSLKKSKLRKGTFSCCECKRRKKRCIISPGSPFGVCDLCRRLACPCLGQEYEENVTANTATVGRRVEHVERLARLLLEQKQQLQLGGAACPLHPLTGAGEDRQSRCHSLSGYFWSVLPHPFIQSLISKHGKAAYNGLREPLELSKTSNQDFDRIIAADIQTACLARKLMRLAVALMYMDSTSSEHVQVLQLNSSAMETAQRYAEAARHLTSQNDLLLSSAGLEAVMMEGHYSIHLGQISEGGMCFRKALCIAQRIRLIDRAAVDDNEGNAARIAYFRLLSANRSLSLHCGEPCEDVEESALQPIKEASDQSVGYLSRVNVRIWRRIIARNIRIQGAWKSSSDREAVLNYEVLETLHIDREMKQAMLSVPACWWQLSHVSNPEPEAGTELNFTRLNTSKDHYNTVVLTHLPYVLYASTTTSSTPFIYSKMAAVSASREVLLRFPLYEQYKHVPASYRALEQKTFIAAVVLLLAHMHSHRTTAFDAIEHERPKDLNALQGTVESMKSIFARDRHNPGSVCARVLRRMMEIEEEMARGMPYRITFAEVLESHDDPSWTGILDVKIPYFGVVRIERELRALTAEVLGLDGALGSSFWPRWDREDIIGDEVQGFAR